jgi:hypothetical protein
MDFLFSGLFWGIILILCGISVIVRIVFNIHIPIFRIVLALILIYFGIRVLVGGNWICSHKNWCCSSGNWNCSTGNGTVFGSSAMSVMSGKSEYKVVFGSAAIDATAEVSGESERISIKTVFGASKLTIASSVSTIIHVSTAFGETRLPDGNSVSFGESTYKNAAAKEGKMPMREIEVRVVFGSFVVVEK